MKVLVHIRHVLHVVLRIAALAHRIYSRWLIVMLVQPRLLPVMGVVASMGGMVVGAMMVDSRWTVAILNMLHSCTFPMNYHEFVFKLLLWVLKFLVKEHLFEVIQVSFLQMAVQVRLLFLIWTETQPLRSLIIHRTAQIVLIILTPVSGEGQPLTVVDVLIPFWAWEGGDGFEWADFEFDDLRVVGMPNYICFLLHF